MPGHRSPLFVGTSLALCCTPSRIYTYIAAYSLHTCRCRMTLALGWGGSMCHTCCCCGSNTSRARSKCCGLHTSILHAVQLMPQAKSCCSAMAVSRNVHGLVVGQAASHMICERTQTCAANRVYCNHYTSSACGMYMYMCKCAGAGVHGSCLGTSLLLLAPVESTCLQHFGLHRRSDRLLPHHGGSGSSSLGSHPW